jgi:hypothetical protein
MQTVLYDEFYFKTYVIIFFQKKKTTSFILKPFITIFVRKREHLNVSEPVFSNKYY